MFYYQIYPRQHVITAYLLIYFFQFLIMRKKNNGYSPQLDHPYTQLALITPNTLLNYPPTQPLNLSYNYQSNDLRQNNSIKPQMRSLDQLYSKDRVPHKMGHGMQRLKDTIQQLAQSNKKVKNRYKQNTIDQDYNLSNQTLPSIAGSTFRKDSSKLMDQIKRVQYKIKALKDQRDEINQQKRQYDYVKPLVELHNQSVMYMQMMMQNNKQHCCHNCHQSNHNNQQQQLPPQYAYPYPVYPPTYPMQYPVASNQSKSMPDLPQNYKTVNKHAQHKPYKKYNFNKLRKFRIAVIAVYFHLLLPKYANRFTLRRYKAHTTYLTSQNILTLKKQIEKQLREKVIQWNMIQISQRVGKARAEKETRRVNQGKTAKLIITEQYNGKDNYQFYLGDVELFLYEFLKTMKQAVEYDDDLENILRYAARGSMPLSFPIDHFYLLDQLYSLKFHPQKLYLQCNRKTAKALLLSCIFIKLIVFSLFFPIKQNEQWKGRMLKVNNMKKQSMIQAEMAAVQMHISGILLHRYAMQLIEQAMQGMDGNIADILADSWPIPQSALIFSGSSDVQSAFSAATYKKIKSNAQRLSLNQDPVNMQGYKQFSLYDFNYIKNLTDFQHLLQEINKASKYEEHVKSIIVQIIDNIYGKLVGYGKEEYKHMKDALLIEQKRLLSVKVSYSSLIRGKRSGAQRKIIKQAMQIVKANRLEQQAGSVQQQQQAQQGQQQQQHQQSQKSA